MPPVAHTLVPPKPVGITINIPIEGDSYNIPQWIILNWMTSHFTSPTHLATVHTNDPRLEFPSTRSGLVLEHGPVYQRPVLASGFNTFGV